MKIQMNGNFYQGTPEQIVDGIRCSWWWKPIPTAEELFKIASGMLKQPIETAEAYVNAMIKTGAAKEERG